MNIETKVNKLDGLKRSIKITVPKDEYILVFNSNLTKYKSSVKFKGFRAGKVPEKVILQKYKDRIHSDAMNKLIEDSLMQSLLEHKLDTASPPKLSIDKVPSFDNELIFTAEFEIYPLFKVADLSEISIEEPEVDINDSDVNQVIKNIQKQHIKWEDSKDNSNSGDKVVLDYEGTIEGKEFENSKQKGFSFIIDDDVKGDLATINLFKEFYKHCVNEKIYTEKTFSYNMPKDFVDKNIAGKLISYKIIIKKISKGILPKLDKEFYKKFGIENGTDKIFKDNIIKHMEHELEQKKLSLLTASINQKLLEKNYFEVPIYMIESEIKNLTNQYKGMMKELDDKTKIDLDNVAKKRAQLNIIYMKITEENKIEVKEQEIQDFISKADTETQNNLIAKIKEDKKYLNHVKNKLLEDAIIKLIVSKCKKNKVKKSFLEVVN